MWKTEFDRWVEGAQAEEAEHRGRQDAHRAVEAKMNGAARGEDYESWHARQQGSRPVREPASAEHTTTDDSGDGSDALWGMLALLVLGAIGWLLWTFVGWVWSEFTATVVTDDSGPTGKYTPVQCQALLIVALADDNPDEMRQEASVEEAVHC